MFYTALLHTSHRRRYGVRSRLFLVLVALGTVYAMFDRRTNFRPLVSNPPRLVTTAREGSPRLAVVGLSTATLDAVLPLAEQGKLPFFATFLESGARARLGSLAPTRPSALWATLATGRWPFRHGLEAERLHSVPWLRGSELRLLPVGIGFEHWGLPGERTRPVEARDREVSPLWTTLRALGWPAAALGFSAALDGLAGAAEPAPAGVSPAERELEALGLPALARALGADRRRLAQARQQLARADGPEALFVRLDGLESASIASFGGFAAAQFEGDRSGRVRRAADALAAYYGGLDGELAELWGALAEPRLLVVVSPYGIEAPTDLGRILLDLADRPRLGGSVEGGPDGLLLARGDGVRRGVQVPASQHRRRGSDPALRTRFADRPRPRRQGAGGRVRARAAPAPPAHLRPLLRGPGGDGGAQRSLTAARRGTILPASAAAALAGATSGSRRSIAQLPWNVAPSPITSAGVSRSA